MPSLASCLFEGKDLGFIEIPEVQRHHGEEAIKVLQNLITALEHNPESKLTKKQKKTLVKIAVSLVATIKEDMQNGRNKPTVQADFEVNPFSLFKRILPWIPH